MQQCQFWWNHSFSNPTSNYRVVIIVPHQICSVVKHITILCFSEKDTIFKLHQNICIIPFILYQIACQ
jgi:hypothetical protein